MPPRQRPKRWDKIEDPAVPLEWILNEHTWAVLFWYRQIETVLCENGWKIVPAWELLRAQEARVILNLSTWMILKWLGENKI